MEAHEAAVNQIDFSDVLPQVSGSAPTVDAQGKAIPPHVAPLYSSVATDIESGLDKLRAAISAKFWEWYRSHSTDEILEIHFLIFAKHVDVEDLDGLFTLLFGPEPLADKTAAPTA